jgi:hypothetical protein
LTEFARAERALAAKCKALGLMCPADRVTTAALWGDAAVAAFLATDLGCWGAAWSGARAIAKSVRATTLSIAVKQNLSTLLPLVVVVSQINLNARARPPSPLSDTCGILVISWRLTQAAFRSDTGLGRYRAEGLPLRAKRSGTERKGGPLESEWAFLLVFRAHS